jgi:AcrR family transcriptional regulator
MATTKRTRTTPRKRPRQARSIETVDALLEATARVLVKHGYDGLSTNRVAEQAGVSIGSLYQYFPSKEALVAELLEKYSVHFQALVLGMLTSAQDHSPRAVAKAIVRAMVELKRTNPKLARVLREQIPRVGRMNRYEENLARIVEATTAFLTTHADALRVRDIRSAAFVVVHAVESATHQGVIEEDYDPETLIEDVTDMVTRYLLRDA